MKWFSVAFFLVVVGLFSLYSSLKTQADGPFILDSWCESSNSTHFSCNPNNDSFSMRIGYAWDVPHRRSGRPETDGWYDNYTYDPSSGGDYVEIPEVTAVDTFVWGIKESMKKMGLPDKIASEHGSAYVQLYDVSTNDPQYSDDSFSHEYPPHLNVITYGSKPYNDGMNAHFYPKADGTLRTDRISYAPTSMCGWSYLRHSEAINVWQPHYDPSCNLIYEERVTDTGQLELRLSSGSPVYTLTNNSTNGMDVHRNGVRIMNIRRAIHDAQYTSSGDFIDLTVMFEIRDFERNVLVKQEIVTEDDFEGAISSHTVVEEPLSGDTPTATPTPSPTATPTPTPTTTATPTTTPMPDTSNPTVEITYPQDADVLERGSTVTITASATDDVGVSRVDFFVSGKPDHQCTDMTAPYECVWSLSGKPNNNFTISATAYDHSENSSADTIMVTSSRN